MLHLSKVVESFHLFTSNSRNIINELLYPSIKNSLIYGQHGFNEKFDKIGEI